MARARARARDGACLDVAIPATLEPLLTPLRTRDHESMPLGRAPSDCITRPFLGISPAVDRDDQATGISTRLVGGHMHAEFTPPIAHRYPHVRVAHRQRACCHGRQDEHCASCSARNYHFRTFVFTDHLFSLAHETSWATSSITTFLRSAHTFQVRKRLAVILREHLPDDFLPPPPIQTSLPLSESDQSNLVGNFLS